MTHAQLKKAVINAFMYALANELGKSVMDDAKINIMQKFALNGAVVSIIDIFQKECNKHMNIIDDVETLKMATWNDLADRYKVQDVVLNIPTAIEELYYLNYEWMKSIKNLERNIHIMARLAISKDVKPKVSRIITDEYEKILSNHVYKYLKKREEMVA